MKKMRFLPMLFMACLMLVACNKDTTKEWEKYYDYPLDDIKGTYSFSYVTDAFDALTETEFCHICEDAQVTIRSYMNSETSIEFKINCAKATFNKTFTGRPVSNEDNFLVKLYNPSTSEYPDYELTAYVYKNDKGDIRLHGFARHIKYHVYVQEGITYHEVKSMTNYYFDVIKNKELQP